MCASCGCGEPNDNHGDSRNITWSQIEQAASAGNVSAKDATQNMQDMARQQG
jgi:hypothetical protein